MTPHHNAAQDGEDEVRFWVKAQRQPNIEPASRPKTPQRSDSADGSSSSDGKGPAPEEVEAGMDHEVQVYVICTETAAAPGAIRVELWEKPS